jgi:hypothetical protein
MAIVQISRITNRKGLQENLPQLAGAELGWSVDSRRLYIGNGTLEEGAPIIGNTEILTEFSDITTLSQYTYEDTAVGYAAQTGPTISDPTIRTVQAKLDDFANVRDFGAIGDGVADDTDAINRALYQLYCIENNSQIRRTLYFPAGTYCIIESIIIPSFAKLMGEGANCTIILLDTSSDISSLSQYVARFGDSKQQTGVNIGNAGATPPQNIEISSMTFQSLETTDIFLVQAATQCYFDSVDFIGPLTKTLIASNTSTDNIAGVRFASTTNLVCNQITFDKCYFSGLTYGINTSQQVKSVTVSNSRFDILFQGVVLGTDVPVNGGATGFRTMYSMFDNIYAQGILYDAVSLNATAHNVFYDVGNNYSGTPTTAIIEFGYDNNVSISDMFERTDVDSQIRQRISITGGAVTTVSELQLGRYSRQGGQTFSIANNVSNQTITTINCNQVRAFRMDYTIVRDTNVRTGTLLVAADSSTTFGSDDTFAENSSTGVTLTVTQSTSTISIKYSSNDTGLTGTLTYSIAHLA